MDKRKVISALIGVLALVAAIVVIIMSVVKKFSPNKEMVLLEDQYDIGEEEVMIILHDEIYEEKGLLIDNRVYIDYETVAEKFNHRFYWDYKENVFTYAKPEEIIQIEAGIKGFLTTKSMIKSKVNLDYEIVKVFANKMYIDIEFVEKNSDMVYEFHKDPNRIIINYEWKEYLYTATSKITALRIEPDIKAPILEELPIGTQLLYVGVDETPEKKFSQVMTDGGVIGYVSNKHITDSYYQEIKSDYEEPVYTSLTRDGKINLVFHQVFNNNSVGSFEKLIKDTKGVTTVSPTWFSIIDNDGNLASIADKQYVEKANSLDIEIWALVDDFHEDVNMGELLSKTSARESLANNLVEAAIEYKLNGINIDFEKIPRDAGKHYIQFIREISVKCRNSGIVLSVDNYVPTEYTEHYDREEQGKVVDYVIVMAYDEHYAGSEVAGPVASIEFVKNGVQDTLEMVAKEKTIIAIPFYTRLWKEDGSGVSAESFAMTPAANLLKDNGVEVEWDDATKHYYGEFEKDGAIYKMWQEEEESIEEKLKVIYEANTAGIAAWKLGLEKESIWNVIARYAN